MTPATTPSAKARPAIRYQGKITTWHDERGFGFIAPNGGGAPVFLHIKAFAVPTRRPFAADVVTYELLHDPRGQPQAEAVAFARQRGASPDRAPQRFGTLFAITITIAFLLLLAILVRAGRLPAPVLGACLGMSMLAYLMYRSDKQAARTGAWRTSEQSLLLIGLAGGWPGALLAQRVYRHKSTKPSFQAAYWGTVTLNCIVLAALASCDG
jgi:uncharacterized membrane protein YsdA (DUF1294 family)/cold shock CspA family protein